MGVKTILYQEDARKALERGMDILAEAVSVTFLAILHVKFVMSKLSFNFAHKNV